MPLDLAEPWSRLPLAILDFETTGPVPTTCEPVSVAVIRVEDGIERDAFYSLLRPSIPIPPDSTAIHGITDALVADAPSLLEVAGQIVRVAKDAVPCGYNGNTFDRRILHRYITGNDCPMFDPLVAWVDPLVIVRKVDKWVPGKGRHKLANVCARWGVPMTEEEQHNALGDVRATGRLVGRLVDRGFLRTSTSAQRVLEYTMLQAQEQERDFNRWLAKRKAAESQQALDLGGDDGARAGGSGAAEASGSVERPDEGGDV